MKNKKTKKKKIYEEDFFQGIFAHAVGKFTKEDLKSSSDWFYTWMRLIKRTIPLSAKRKSRVLEVGCSIGGFAVLLEKEGFKEVYASDISEYVIKYAKKLTPSIHFSSFDLEKSIPISGRFDYIFGFEVLEHINNPQKALENVCKKLKKDGYLIMSTPPPYKRFIETPTHVSVMGDKEWKKLLKKAGFRKIIVKKVTFIPILWRYNRYLNYTFPFSVDVPIIGLNTTIFYFAKK